MTMSAGNGCYQLSQEESGVLVQALSRAHDRKGGWVLWKTSSLTMCKMLSLNPSPRGQKQRAEISKCRPSETTRYWAQLCPFQGTPIKVTNGTLASVSFTRAIVLSSDKLDIFTRS